MKGKSFHYGYRFTKSPIFGRALVIEIVPPQTCPFNCIHCRYGRITACTIERVDYLEKRNPAYDLPTILEGHSGVDHIVLTGRGEPALCAGISSLIDTIKMVTKIPVAVMSCGTLLWRPDVRRELMHADMVTASIDAADKTVFHCVNRPHDLVPFERFVHGLRDFSQSYKGELMVRVHLLDGVTAIEAEVVKLASLVNQIKAKRVFLTTASRTPPNKCVFPVEDARLRYFAGFFGDNAMVVVLEAADGKKRKEKAETASEKKNVREKEINYGGSIFGKSGKWIRKAFQIERQF